jgi:hypothetical protein
MEKSKSVEGKIPMEKSKSVEGKIPTEKSKDQGDEQAQHEGRSVAVIVLQLKQNSPKGGPKRKYSQDLRDVQVFERNASSALYNLASSVEMGIREWRKATDRSARRRQDGAIRDALDNYAKATGKQLRAMSRVPEDMIRAVRSLKIRKIARRLLPIL